MVAGHYQPLADGGANALPPAPPDQTCPLQSHQRTKISKSIWGHPPAFQRPFRPCLSSAS